MHILNELGITIPDEDCLFSAFAAYTILREKGGRTALNCVSAAQKKALNGAYTLFCHVSRNAAVEQAIRDRYYGTWGPSWPRSTCEMCIEIALSRDPINTPTCLAFAFAPILEHALTVLRSKPSELLDVADFDVGWSRYMLDLHQDE